jgi:hypothetical protein
MIPALSIALVALVVVFILWVRPQDLPQPEPVSPTRPWEDHKARIYENLRDLQFDYRLDKLSDADYQRGKAELQKELAMVLAEIDRLTPSAPDKVRA